MTLQNDLVYGCSELEKQLHSCTKMGKQINLASRWTVDLVKTDWHPLTIIDVGKPKTFDTNLKVETCCLIKADTEETTRLVCVQIPDRLYKLPAVCTWTFEAGTSQYV